MSEKIMIEYIGYNVREYVPQLIRCHKCQGYRHITEVLKGKPRCRKYEGEHEYGHCGSNNLRKFHNCRVDFTSLWPMGVPNAEESS